MNRAFKTRQHIGHISSVTRKQNKTDSMALSAKKCRDVIEACYEYRCAECKDNRLNCYCIAA